MDEGDARPGLPVQVNRVQPGTAGFELVLALAARVLAQDRYLTCRDEGDLGPDGWVMGAVAAARPPRWLWEGPVSHPAS